MTRSTILLIIITAMSCTKKDTINHYLNKPVTEQELIDNGFYKYLYTYTHIYDYEKNGNKDSISEAMYKDSLKIYGKIFKYELYSNVKPQKREDGKLYPISLFKAYDDEVQEKERIEYLENELDNRIVSYLFENNVLKNKDVFVYAIDKSKKYIVDFRSKEKIISYYDSLKIPIVPIIEGKRSTIGYTTLFYINGYKTQIYYYKVENIFAYDMFTNYIQESLPPWDAMNDWYDKGDYEFEQSK